MGRLDRSPGVLAVPEDGIVALRTMYARDGIASPSLATYVCMYYMSILCTEYGGTVRDHNAVACFTNKAT